MADDPKPQVPAVNPNLTSDDALNGPQGRRKSRTLTKLPLAIIGGLVLVILFVCANGIFSSAPKELSEEEKLAKEQADEAEKAKNSSNSNLNYIRDDMDGEGILAEKQRQLEHDLANGGEGSAVADQGNSAPQTGSGTKPSGSGGDPDMLKKLQQMNAELLADNQKLREQNLKHMAPGNQSQDQAEMRLRQEIAALRKNQFQQGLSRPTAVTFAVSQSQTADRKKSGSAGGDRSRTPGDQGYNTLTQADYGSEGVPYGEENATDLNGGRGGAGPRRPSAAPGLASYEAYSNKGSWDLGKELTAPESPYLVRAGMIIPCTLITGINSDTPGQALAQVSRNVYDTATGKYLLIPQGTRVVGTYGTNPSYGQKRMLIAWQRLIYPDNKALDLGSMPGADVSGNAGFEDQVNNHWFQLIAGAFLMSGVTATVSVATATDSNDDNKTNFSDEARQTLASQFGQVIANVIQREMAVSPTLTIRPGYRFNITVTKDLSFGKPYKAFDYQTVKN